MAEYSGHEPLSRAQQAKITQGAVAGCPARLTSYICGARHRRAALHHGPVTGARPVLAGVKTRDATTKRLITESDKKSL